MNDHERGARKGTAAVKCVRAEEEQGRGPAVGGSHQLMLFTNKTKLGWKMNGTKCFFLYYLTINLQLSCFY